MKHLLKHLKPIAYLFASLILLQSCVVYKSKPTSIEKATKYNSRHIKVKTFEDGNYIFRWINEDSATISSQYGTRRAVIDTSRIKSIIIYDPDPREAQFSEALIHKGMMRFVTKDYDYKFFKVEERNDNIYGYLLNGRDTTSIVIPKENIEAIKLDSRGKMIGIGISPFVIGFMAFVIAMRNTCWDC